VEAQALLGLDPLVLAFDEGVAPIGALSAAQASRTIRSKASSRGVSVICWSSSASRRIASSRSLLGMALVMARLSARLGCFRVKRQG